MIVIVQVVALTVLALTFTAGNQWPHLPSELRSADPSRLVRFHQRVAPVVTIIEAAVVSVCGLSAVLLIVGAAKGLNRLMVPWLINCVASVLWCLVEFGLGCSVVDADLAIGLVLIVRSLICMATSIYFGLVVFSLYQQLNPKFQLPFQALAVRTCCSY